VQKRLDENPRAMRTRRPLALENPAAAPLMVESSR
jgi:hypothetical protein